MGADLWERAAIEWDRLTGDTVFADLGYEPNCLLRHQARDAGMPKDQLPPPCGLCPQELFHDATEFDVLFGGAAGGGKSAALVMEAVRVAIRYPGIRIGLFRRTYGELEESLLAELKQRLDKIQDVLGGRYNQAKYELTFPGGSLLMFRYAENMQDATRRQGGQYQMLMFDERTLMPPDVIAFLSSRLRSGRSDIPVLGIRSGTNPGGVGHGDVKQRFIDATDHGKNVVTDNRGRTVRFIQSRLTDNPHLNPEYADDLNALPEAMRKAFRDGSWDSFQGQVFQELSRDRHIVPRMSIPPEWRRIAGIDWGWTAPWAVVWCALDPDGRAWVYRELYERNVPEGDQARKILATEAAAGETHVVRYIDPSMNRGQGEALPIAARYRQEGCAVQEAKNDRLPGWARVHSYLQEGPACLLHRDMGWTTCPRLHFLDGTTPNLWRTLAALPYSKIKIEDADTDAEDHACLVAGTPVLTSAGAVPIEQVQVGELVWTRAGYRPVLAAGLTAHAADVVRVELTNGQSLTGTGSHPVWTTTRGWQRLDALRYADILSGWAARPSTSANPSPSAVSPSTDTPAAPAGRTPATSGPFLRMLRAAWKHFTAKCGRRPADRSLTAIMSTTPTGTPRTTTPPTSSSSAPTSTSRTTPMNVAASASHSPRQPGELQPSGMAPRPVSPGTGSTAPGPGTTGPLARNDASGAMPSIRPDAPTDPGSAPTTAGPQPAAPPVSTTSNGRAGAADPSSPRTATPTCGSVPVRALCVTPLDVPADVYNLTVQGCPEFVAAGVVVHNCDALRYALFSIGTSPVFITPADTPTEALDGRALLTDRHGIGFPQDLTHVERRTSIYAP